MRAALLTAVMNLTPLASVDILRFLRVPAIVWTLRAARGRVCQEKCAPSRRSQFRRARAG
ncbi:MAG: hypothetical protein ABI779_08005 [Acidobacteriota bacterium]